MNEDGTPIETSTDNIPADQGGETTTPQEIAELLNLPVPAKEEAVTEEEETEEVDDPVVDDPKEPVNPAETISKEDEPAKSDPVEDDAPVFELEVEDANGDKVTLKPGDDLEQVLKDFEPKSNGQIFSVLQSLQKLEAEKTAYDEKQAEDTAKADHDAAIAEINSGWEKEIETLQGSKRLEVSSDGKKPARVDEVFKFMGEENAKRAEDGRPFIRSFEDALDKLELRETKEAEAQKAKEEKELAKKRGGMVGGSSAPVTSGTPVYKGGARNANDALRSMKIL